MHPMYPMSRMKFLQMALETRHQVFENILTFHAHAAKQGYVAIDFYDGSIMYDFNIYRTVIGDIDCYAKTPYLNKMGRLEGGEVSNPHGIILLGANGSGKSTLGRELAHVLNFAHLDVIEIDSTVDYQITAAKIAERFYTKPGNPWRVIPYPLGELKTYRFTVIFAQNGIVGGGWLYARHSLFAQ